MILIMIILLVFLLAGVIAAISVKCLRNREYSYYQTAAYRIVKEAYLDAAIRGEAITADGEKMMICLKITDQKSSPGHVFDPAKAVSIGRIQQENQLCIRDVTVSAQHCIIYQEEEELLLQDLGSSNGTAVKRGRRTIWLEPGRAVPLIDRDRLYVGNVAVTVVIFYYNTLFM